MVSIIIPVYNVSEYLERCLESVCTQTYRDLEIILVDDGSNDGSSYICDVYKARDSRITVIHKENGGLVSARKAGLMVARGDYVGFVDSDDWIESEMYEHLLSWAVKYQTDIVLAGCIEEVGGQATCRTNRIKSGVYDKEKLREEVYPYMLCMQDFFSIGIQPYIWNKLIRRDLAYTHMLTVDDRIRVGEDVAAVMPMLAMADRVAITDYCDYHYCIHETSMMWQKACAEKEWRELCILHQFLYKCFSKFRLEGFIWRQLYHYTVSNMLTRAYEKVAQYSGERVLWPFRYELSDKKCIVYSAGNFGRAVYYYLKKYFHDKVCLWVDREAERYQSLGLPVCRVEDVAKRKDADVLVAMMDTSLERVIRENLTALGMENKRIYGVRIMESEITNILGMANMQYGGDGNV